MDNPLLVYLAGVATPFVLAAVVNLLGMAIDRFLDWPDNDDDEDL